MTDEAFALRVEGYLRGTLSPEDRRALTDLVEDPRYDRLFQDQVRLHIRLSAELAAEGKETPRTRAESVLSADSETRKLKVMKSLERELDLPLPEAARRPVSRRYLGRSPRGSRFWVFASAALAATVTIVVAVSLTAPAPSKPRPAPTARTESPASPAPLPPPSAPAPAPVAAPAPAPPPPSPDLPAPPPEPKPPAAVPPPAPPPEKPRPPEPGKPAPAPAPTVVASLARVETLQGEAVVLRAGARLPARAGLGLLAGDGLESAGRLGVRYPDATSLDLAPGAAVRSLAEGPGGEKRVTLERGTFAAEVTRQPAGRPLRFLTPHAEATVLGTTLRLVVEAGSTRLEVDEGKVRLTRLSDRKSVEVPSGHFAVAGAGLELAVRPSPIDEILLAAGRAKVVGKEWRLVKDEQATSGEALEIAADLNRDFPDRAKGKGMLRQIPSAATFTFAADAGREYRLWIRARCLAAADRANHDAFALDPGDAVFGTPCPWFGPLGENAYIVDHVSKQEGYWWVGGNEREVRLRTSLRFNRPGLQTLKLYALEGPLRVDAVWLSATQKDRPAPGARGPEPK